MGQYIQCYGKQLPGYINQTSLKDAECGQAISNEGSTAKFSPQPIYCTEFDSPVLPTGSKLSFHGSTCGVGADFTACVDSAKHGFVLRQDGNSTGF
ncbi:hypothetical protein CCUG63695_01529 [Mycobacteroides franklinii]|uniref:Uncharacterized protein n=1 Tax=Mycobacteroides franklinii TaxID=948102 RepID=A0A4R8RG00_9MYCO|nr:hypothetical protein CCUG64054_00530 [Mycobacteroides franklinii]TDZ53768.1 hypothetical protein CCUG63697_00069 [Mycobacteroides franklinii]TDZ60423.1 hypothetical protein CCUG63696_00532 [Mycobacteroides franklinii]TDZ65822.1 hypothetical protein CCUG63695_01529 [Mycobacteroides franklinii]TDZ73992.1 hypothetical protein CCUG64056_00530 [Mycobacteroides franklinii]